MKLLVDKVPGVAVIAIGSASFDLSNKVGEPLTGRDSTLHLYPVAQLELLARSTKYELAQNLTIDPKTVGRYLDLLERAFVLVTIRGYSRNLRKEITTKSKYYFYDTGIRNAVISNFNPLNVRDDVGKLWAGPSLPIITSGEPGINKRLIS